MTCSSLSSLVDRRPSFLSQTQLYTKLTAHDKVKVREMGVWILPWIFCRVKRICGQIEHALKIQNHVREIILCMMMYSHDHRTLQ